MGVSIPVRRDRAAPAPARAPRGPASTRARLLESAEELFAQRGLHGVTTHDIAREAGFAAGTFYLHFRDKSDVFRQIALDTAERLRECVTRAVASDGDVAAAVEAHATALVGFAEANRDVIRILFSADADAAAVESDVLDWLAASIEERRRERAAAGRDDDDLDPGVLSQAIVGMWARVLAWWTEDPDRAARERVVRTLTRIQLSGTRPLSGIRPDADGDGEPSP